MTKLPSPRDVSKTAVDPLMPVERLLEEADPAKREAVRLLLEVARVAVESAQAWGPEVQVKDYPEETALLAFARSLSGDSR